MTLNKVWAKAFFLPLSFAVLVASEAIGSPQKQVTVVFRYDDYSSSSPTDAEIKLIDAFKKHGVPCTFGVIPYVCAGDVHDPRPQGVVPLTPVKANILKDGVNAGVLEVALHGYSHQTVGAGADGRHAEFAGLGYNDQVEKIARGKGLLEEMLGIKVTIFCPPWNRYDENTIRALERLGFRSLSAGSAGLTKGSSPLRFLPSTCGLSDLRDAVGLARKTSDAQPVIVVLFHLYDFLEDNRQSGKLTYQDFVEILTWVTSQRDVRTRTLGETAEVIGDLDSRRFWSYSNFASSWLHRLSPSFLGNLYSDKVYLSSQAFRSLRLKGWLLLSLFYLVALAASVAVAFSMGCFVFSRMRYLEAAAKYGGVVLLGLSSLYAFRKFEIYFRAATALTCILGLCIGAWGASYKLKRLRGELSS